ALAQYRGLRRTAAAAYNFDESQLDALADDFVRLKRFDAAVRIFALNVETYPRSSRAYRRLAEAYANGGDRPRAIANYRKAFALAVAFYGLTRDYDRELALLALVCRVAEGVIAVVSAVTKQALLAVATAAAGATAGGATAADTAAANALGSALFSVQGLATLLGATAFAI